MTTNKPQDDRDIEARDDECSACKFGVCSAHRNAAPAPFDVEAMLRECVPGGSLCDPQRVADAIRAYVGNAAPAPGQVLSGWTMVPHKVTNAMIDAANNVPSGIAGTPPHWQWVWDAMIAASPAIAASAAPAPTECECGRTDGKHERACPVYKSRRKESIAESKRFYDSLAAVSNTCKSKIDCGIAETCLYAPAPAAQATHLDLLRRLVSGDVGQDTRRKLSTGQGTETEDGKTWLTAIALVDDTPAPSAQAGVAEGSTALLAATARAAAFEAQILATAPVSSQVGAQAERDAARWRWLRDSRRGLLICKCDDGSFRYALTNGPAPMNWYATTDETIDAALSAENTAASPQILRGMRGSGDAQEDNLVPQAHETGPRRLVRGEGKGDWPRIRCQVEDLR